MAEASALPLVVIIGAGCAGTTLALKLHAKRRAFLLINPADYFHLNFAAVRACCVKGWAEKSIIPLSPMFGDSFKQGRVVNINPSTSTVTLESKEEISYGYLVIATGLVHQWPIKLVGVPPDDVFKMYKALVEKAEAAQKITVVGGGATGVEIAAELATFYPSKEITLIHSSNHLLTPALSERSQTFLQNQLRTQFNIKLLLEEKVTNLDEITEDGGGILKTDKDSTVESDLVYKCIGVTLNTDAYKDGLASAMTDRNALKVNNRFEVEGFEKIYALGDCTNIPEGKIGAYAIKHGEHIAKNIFKLDRGQNHVDYKPDNLPVIAGVSLGPNSGFARTKKDWKIPAFLIKRMKSRHLFSDKWWKDMKQQCPS